MHLVEASRLNDQSSAPALGQSQTKMSPHRRSWQDILPRPVKDKYNLPGRWQRAAGIDPTDMKQGQHSPTRMIIARTLWRIFPHDVATYDPVLRISEGIVVPTPKHST